MARRDLTRLLRPKSIALFGGGWAENVAEQLLRSGFDGAIWPVHPKRADIRGIRCIRSIGDLPAAPDAAFIGVNREASIDVVRTLAAMGGGGATCFASGFLESEAEGAGGAELQAKLVEAAGGMPILGPNCYGFLNYLDTVTLWPDQHGGKRVQRGVAIIAQSSNIAINMTMQKRSLPIAYVIAAGNQAQTGAAAIADALLDDPRVSAIGMYLEGFGDIRALEAFASRARKAGKPVVALKVGRSAEAKAATMTHTASLAGDSAAAAALLKRLGMIETRSVAAFLETLKLLDAFGPLPGNVVLSVSCSGGEASLMADLADGSAIRFRAFGEAQRAVLKAELGPIVTIANPFDYHTFIWGDVARMTKVFTESLKDNFDLTVFVLDLPRDDRCDPSGYDCAVEAIIAARRSTGAKVAVLASLPENLPEPLAERFRAAGVLPLHGMEEGLSAIDAAIRAGRLLSSPLSRMGEGSGVRVHAGQEQQSQGSLASYSGTSKLFACITNENSAQHAPSPPAPLPFGRGEIAFDPAPVLLACAAAIGHSTALTEAEAKRALAAFGLPIPRSVEAPTAEALAEAAKSLAFPLALKGLGIAHKTEAGAVRLNIANADALLATARAMPAAQGFLAEEMVTGGIAELLIGVTRDATGLFLLTIGAGGVLAELLQDTASLLLPATRGEIAEALTSLRMAPLLSGYRGKPAAKMEGVIDAIEAIARYAEAHAETLVELDVNPLIARADDAVAVDALIIRSP